MCVTLIVGVTVSAIIKAPEINSVDESDICGARLAPRHYWIVGRVVTARDAPTVLTGRKPVIAIYIGSVPRAHILPRT